MGYKVFEALHFEVTAPGSTLTPSLPIGTDSNIIRAFKSGKAAIIDYSLKSQAAAGGSLRFRSSKTEQIQGVRVSALQNNPLSLNPQFAKQPVYANDNLIIEIAGSANSGDIEIAQLIVAYEDAQGLGAPRQFGVGDLLRYRKLNPDSIIQTMQGMLSFGTAGGYSGSAALSTFANALYNDTVYALLGYSLDGVCGGIRLSSNSDFGSLAIGAPGTNRADLTKNYFFELSYNHGVPIPTFNSINLPQIFIDGAQDENGVDVSVTLYLQELSKLK